MLSGLTAESGPQFQRVENGPKGAALASRHALRDCRRAL
jgi:hypothetical protein